MSVVGRPSRRRIRIESDGTAEGTRVYVVGEGEPAEDITHMVRSVTWQVAAMEAARVTLELAPGRASVEVEGIEEPGGAA